MSTKKLRELQEKLLRPPNGGAPFQNSASGRPGWFSGEQSTSRPYPGHHSFPPLQGLDEPTSIQIQTEYLTSFSETATDEYFSGFDTRSQQTTQSGVSWDSIFGLDSSSSNSLNSSSGYFESSTEILPSSTVFSFGQGSGHSSGQSETLGSPSHGSQQPSIAGTTVTTTEGHVCGITSCDQEASDLIGVTPFNAGTEIDIQSYLIQDAKVEVDFYDLENRVFEKQQSRKDKQARQRIINGKVKFMVFSDRQVKDVRVWVRRETKAAKLEKDDNGMVPIQAILHRKDNRNMVEYQVDLDSVYEIEGSKRPVYKLAKVHTQERNKFELLVQVTFDNGEVSELFKSKPFLIKTKRINDEPAESALYSKEKRKRPSTCPSSTARWVSQGKHQPTTMVTQKTLQTEADSTDSMSPQSNSSFGSGTTARSSEDASQVDNLVVKHLKAQQANIERLSFGCMMQTSRGDIAYHLRLTNSDVYQTLEEGVVVGFFPDDDGPATIEPLSSENASQAVMAGVISRSAYVEAHAPLDTDKGQTDIVCVIGMVKVKIVGSVRTGERIYASTGQPGTGIPESHLPLGAFIIGNHTLLGMAMETCKPRYHDEVNLVRCFVCIVLGINSHQLSSEVENILENIDMDIKVAIGKSNKTTCRRMFLIILGFITFLILLGFFMYELLTPGSLFRYYLCRIGSSSGPQLGCMYNTSEEDVHVHYIPFPFPRLEEKIPSGEKKPIALGNETNSVFYFLNLDRCAYGGRTDASKYFPEKTKPVRGPTFVASFKNNCSKIYSYDGRAKKWKLKECNTTDLTMTCKCNAAGVFGCQSLGLLISFAAFCLLACEQNPN